MTKWQKQRNSLDRRNESEWLTCYLMKVRDNCSQEFNSLSVKKNEAMKLLNPPADWFTASGLVFYSSES